MSAADRAEIRRLVERYADAADRRDGDAFAAVFATDGVLVTPRGERRGHGELAAVPDRLRRYDQTVHTVTDHDLVALDGDVAAAATHCTAEHLTVGDACVESYVMTIRYDDRFRREDGAWRIAERRLVLLAEERRQA